MVFLRGVMLRHNMKWMKAESPGKLPMKKTYGQEFSSIITNQNFLTVFLFFLNNKDESKDIFYFYVFVQQPQQTNKWNNNQQILC